MNLNKIVISFTLLISIAFCVSAQKSKTPNEVQAEPDIEVTTSIINQNACLIEGSYILSNGKTQHYKRVRFDIEMQNALTNKSDLPLLLDKRGGTVYGYSIFEKSANSTLGRHRQSGGWGRPSTDEYTTEVDTPSNWFLVLNKGEILNLKHTQAWLFFDYFDEYAVYDNREYFLTFALTSLSGAVSEKNVLNELRRKWSKVGYLWFEDFETKSVLIRFPSRESLKVCEN